MTCSHASLHAVSQKHRIPIYGALTTTISPPKLLTPTHCPMLQLNVGTALLISRTNNAMRLTCTQVLALVVLSHSATTLIGIVKVCNL